MSEADYLSTIPIGTSWHLWQNRKRVVKPAIECMFITKKPTPGQPETFGRYPSPQWYEYMAPVSLEVELPTTVDHDLNVPYGLLGLPHATTLTGTKRRRNMKVPLLTG